MYEYYRVIYQSFGCIDMLSLCIYESFELLIVNVGYEYECPVNLSLVWMFTFSVVFVCELVNMPPVGYKMQVSYKSNDVSNLCFPF